MIALPDALIPRRDELSHRLIQHCKAMSARPPVYMTVLVAAAASACGESAMEP